MSKRIQNLLVAIETEKEKEKELELAILQAQIKPHFLYNTIYSIKQQCQLEGSKNSARLLQCLSDYYRISLSNGADFIPISKEIEHIKNYISIERSKISKDFDVHYDIDPYLHDNKIAKLTLQPIIENAIQHGIKNSRNKGVIQISCQPTEHCILIQVIDNGCGIEPKILREIQNQCNESLLAKELPCHYGISNVHHRLRLYYGNDYGLQIKSHVSKGTTVTIKIPYCQEEVEDEL